MELSSGHSRAVKSMDFMKNMIEKKVVAFVETVKYCKTLTNIECKCWKAIGLLKRITFQTSSLNIYDLCTHMSINRKDKVS